MTQKHYICGSGMVGCLYDYGSNAHETKEAAIEDLAWLANEDELTEEQIEEMRKDLRTNGIHYFPSKVRKIIGADYCEVSEANGPCPESEDL